MATVEVAAASAQRLAALNCLALPACASTRMPAGKQAGPTLVAVLAALRTRHTALCGLALDARATPLSRSQHLGAPVAHALRAERNATLVFCALRAVTESWQA